MKKRAPSAVRGRSRASALPRATRRSTSPRISKTTSAGSANQRGSKSAGGGRSGKMTVNHDQIRRWAEARGGTPASVKRTARGRQGAGIIRIDFPGYSGAGALKPISWEEWFETFEDRELALIYQEKTASGKQSRFNKLVARKPAG